MDRSELRLTMCAPVDDDPPYFAEITVDEGGSSYTWAEVYLDGVEQSADGVRRVEHAHAIVRMWFDDKHFDVPYADVVSTLDRARTRLLLGESHVPSE
jgi:hypothetical protein